MLTIGPRTSNCIGQCITIVYLRVKSRTRSASFHLEGLADVAAARQRPEQAAILYAQGYARYQAVGDRLGVASCVGLARAATAQGRTGHAMALYVAAARAQLDKAAWAEEQAMTLEQAMAYALRGVS